MNCNQRGCRRQPASVRGARHRLDGTRPAPMQQASSPSPSMILTVATVGVLITAIGCSRGYTGTVKANNTNNIQRLSNFYADFQQTRFGRGPKDEAELKTHIQSKTPQTLQIMGIEPGNVDEIWISERDHKPFKVRYGVDSPYAALAAVVFEQEGVGGKRQVGFNDSKFEEVDEARYKDLWEGRGITKAPPIAGPAVGRPDGGAKK